MGRRVYEYLYGLMEISMLSQFGMGIKVGLQVELYFV